jgi:hypothetical protein
MIRISQMKRQASKRGDNAFASVMEGTDYAAQGNARDDMEASIRTHDDAVTTAMTSLERMDQFGDNGVGNMIPITSSGLRNSAQNSGDDDMGLPPSSSSEVGWTRRLSSGLSMVGSILGSKMMHTTELSTDETSDTRSSSQYIPTLGSIRGNFSTASSSQRDIGNPSIRSALSMMNHQSFLDIPTPTLPHESHKAELSRLTVAIMCFIVSILCTVFLGRGQLGLFLGCYMYDSGMVTHQSQAGTRSQC